MTQNLNMKFGDQELADKNQSWFCKSKGETECGRNSNSIDRADNVFDSENLVEGSMNQGHSCAHSGHNNTMTLCS
jgi:hypothetical protein